ncbi:MAG: B12-binding domain-containing radical SAM protein [Deltaproteobacteria bacterium]|nr:B12-binding domain-containing radical SAM protein [Deltaproteobacteria bacterium]
MNVLLIEMNPFAPVSTPISLGYIAAYLRTKGFVAETLTLGEDSSVSPVNLYHYIDSFRPALVGISAYQRTMLCVLGLAKFIKSVDNNIKVAIGGPQATFMPTEALGQMPHVDYICRSSGETTLLGIARAVQEGTPFSNLSGVSYRDSDNRVRDTEPLDQLPDLDSYPSPYLEDVFDYSGMGEAIMLTSRGCPHNCIFCYTPRAFNHKIAFHSVDRVMEEIRWIRKKGIRRLWFADPNVSYKWKRMEELLDRMLKEELKMQMWLQTRADLVNPEMMRMMKRAGVSTLAFGLESASERVLPELDKHMSIEKITEAIRTTQSEGIEVELFTMFGLPHETFEDGLKTLEFVKKNQVKIMGNTNSQQMKIYFGTHMSQHYEDYGIRPLNTRRNAYMSIGSQYETNWMSYKEMQTLRDLWRAESLDRGRRIVS